MGGDPNSAADETLPPLSGRMGLVCPACRKAPQLDGEGRRPTHCTEHQLALVEARALIDAPGDPLLGRTIAGRFTIVARLGLGSMGAVYRARQEPIGRYVALKIVRKDRAYDGEMRARFEREARATSALVSANTVTVFDYGEAEDGSWFLAMELLEGETLGERLRRRRRLPVDQAISLTLQALNSLGEAHAKGIVHRDLKPDNLFLANKPPGAEVLKILDFGIAKLIHEPSRIDQLETQAGTVFGTPRYMSPEQAQGGALDARSDLYAIGLLLYQMLSGRPPFIDDDAVVVMARHIKDEPPLFSEIAGYLNIPPAIEAVVRRTLAKDPDARPQSAQQLAEELVAARAAATALGSGVHATSWGGPSSDVTPVVTRATPWAKRLFGFLAAGLAAASLAGYALRVSPHAPVVATAESVAASERPGRGVAPPSAAAAPEISVADAPAAIADGGAKNVGPSGQAAPEKRPPTANPPKHRIKPQQRKLAERYGRFE